MRAALAALALVAGAGTARADEFSVEVRGWTVVSLDGARCAMHQTFDGPGDTELLYTRDLAGNRILGISNANWSATPGQSYAMVYAIDGFGFSGDGTRGADFTGRKGFAARVGEDFERRLAGGSSLRFFLDDKLVDHLSLSGSGAALAALDRCMARLRADQAAIERERKRWEHIPADPFAAAKPRAVPGAAPVPLGDPAAWLVAADYPARALREGRQGPVGATLAIGADGRVTGCTIAASSGSPDLDAATCLMVARRARFTPATDAQGAPASGSWTGTFTWSIPQD